MADEQPLNTAVRYEADESELMTPAVWDAFWVTDWLASGQYDNDPPPSADPSLDYAHWNPDAWPLIELPDDMDGTEAWQLLETATELAMALAERFNKHHGKDGKFASKPGGAGGGSKPVDLKNVTEVTIDGHTYKKGPLPQYHDNPSAHTKLGGKANPDDDHEEKYKKFLQEKFDTYEPLYSEPNLDKVPKVLLDTFNEFMQKHKVDDTTDWGDIADGQFEAAIKQAQAANAKKRFNPYHGKDGKFSSGKGVGGAAGGGVGIVDRPVPKQASKPRQRISAAEARGNSRAVSEREFDQIADQGQVMLNRRMDNRKPLSHLDDDREWRNIKDDAYIESQKSWGGATIDSHTGRPLKSDADMYALTIKKPGQQTVSVPENAKPHEFHAAMDQAKERFRAQLEYEGSHLGVFHDDENHRIDIDPVLVVRSLHEVEAIGAHTHAIGGAYHFKSGDGFWPPHVAE